MASQPPSIEPSDDGPNGRDGFLVRTPFSAEWIADLKQLLPSKDRRWWEDSHCWWVAAEHMETIEKLTLAHFGELEVTDEDGAVEMRTRAGERMVQERLL